VGYFSQINQPTKASNPDGVAGFYFLYRYRAVTFSKQIIGNCKSWNSQKKMIVAELDYFLSKNLNAGIMTRTVARIEDCPLSILELLKTNTPRL
jgi:hypothetical protein